ncbi:hypothetical protein AQ436_01910 [Arthrobacter sp. EpRS66]|nr:hypothetical protein AQ436_01910 [Arthrobacter sp. EpRS66]
MADPNPEPEVTIEQRLEILESELNERRRSEAIKDSIIMEYRQALDAELFKVAVLNGQLKLATQPTA